jgi:predicted DsbA family dithiol-disulfide isomerase
MGRDDVALRVRAWPLELVNGEPMAFAKAQGNAEDLAAQVAPGLFSGLREETWPSSTLEGLALVEAAYRIDGPTGERASLALRDALFEEGCDVSDPSQLAELASTFGVSAVTDVDRAAVLASLEEGRARGVAGSPHFFCGEADSFCPSLDIGRTEAGGRTIELRRDALRDFLAQCLA